MSIFQNKIKAKAMQIHKESVDSLEYVVPFPPRKKIGITFRRHNEWGIVKVVPPGSDIIVGSLLSAVNGKSVLLMKFDDAIAKAAEALTSGKAFEITFLAPYRLEGVMKKHETRRMGKGWKSYYFELNSGILQCFVKKQGRLKYEWDLANETQHQTLITLAPRNILNDGEMGIMIVKGGEKVLLKAEDNTRTQTWGAFIYLAIVIANGGNPDMYAQEKARIQEREPDAQVDMKALMAQAEQAEREALRKHAEAEKKAKIEAEKAAAEAARLKKEAEEAADGDARAAAEEQARLAEERAVAAQAKEDEELAMVAKATKSSRRASLVAHVASPELTPEPAPVADSIPELEEEEDEMDVLVMDEPEPEMPAPPTAEEEAAAAAQIEAERLAAEKAEEERLAAEKAEADRIAAEEAAKKAEEERLAAEKAEADRIAAEKAEEDRLAAEKAEAELAATLSEAEAAERALKLAAEKEEADRVAAAEKAEADRIAAEEAAKKAEEERLAAEKAEEERLAAEALAQAEEVNKDLAHAEDEVLEEWADIAGEEEAAAELAAEQAAAAEFSAVEEVLDLDAEEEDEQEEAEYEAANADANMGFAYVDPSKHSHDDDDAAAEAAAAAALSRMGMSAEEQQPVGDEKLKGFVKPRRSIFDKWQTGSDKLFNSASAATVTRKKATSDAEAYRPKLMKTKDAKSWMVQL